MKGPAFLCGIPMLRVADVPVAVAHYRDALGFDVAWIREDGIASVGWGELSLLLADHHAAPGAWVYAHLSTVQEVNELHALYQANGVAIREAPAARAWGLYEMRVADLDGNVLRIASDL